MTTWRHADRMLSTTTRPHTDDTCGCRDPRPDPESPCRYVSRGHWCAFPAEWHDAHGPQHPHQPSACDCGHHIQAVP